MRYVLVIAGTLSFLAGAAMLTCAVMDEALVRTVLDKLLLNQQGTHAYQLLLISAVCFSAMAIGDAIEDRK